MFFCLKCQIIKRTEYILSGRHSLQRRRLRVMVNRQILNCWFVMWRHRVWLVSTAKQEEIKGDLNNPNVLNKTWHKGLFITASNTNTPGLANLRATSVNSKTEGVKGKPKPSKCTKQVPKTGTKKPVTLAERAFLWRRFTERYVKRLCEKPDA